MHIAANVPSCWDRAIAYGDGIFESVLVLDGAAPLWKFHRSRLEHSLQRLAIRCDIGELEKSFLSFAIQNPDALVKITVARSGGARGYDARQASDCAVQLTAHPLPHYSRTRIAGGVRLHVCHQRLPHNPELAGIKHLNRLQQVLAASERQRDWADEGLMLDSSGAVVEGTMSNIFIMRDGKLVTPSLEHCGVAGVMRAAITDKFAQQLSLPVQETRLLLADLLSADSVFICNSVFGIWPVNAIGVSSLPINSLVNEKLWHELTALGYARLYG